MDPRLLDLYERELGHLKDMGQEFARQYPKIASRLSMEGLQVTDPYVERLLEGFAFLAARIQLRLDAEFPKFTDRLLEICYPNFLAPLPSMTIVQFTPNAADPALAAGPLVERDTDLRGLLGKGEETACRFRVAQAVRLWPLEVSEAQYLPHVAELPSPPALLALAGRRARAGLRLRLKPSSGVAIGKLALDALSLHFTGQDNVAFKLHERVLGHTLAVLVRPVQTVAAWSAWLPASQIAECGFEPDDALLPVEPRSFQGYRHLQEYFALPERYLFVSVIGLDKAIAGRAAAELELIFLFDQPEPYLEGVVDKKNIALHCAPAVNLFKHRCDRIAVREGMHEFHVVPDVARPQDYEVFELSEVSGYGLGADSEQTFLPLYAAFHTESPQHAAYYCHQREPRVLSARQRKQGTRSSYIGSEVFVALVDPDEAPFAESLRALSVKALCTNRDLPLHMPIGLGKTDFVLEISAPVEAVRVLKGPSKPAQRARTASHVWQLVNHLSLNHLSLTDTDPEQGAAALREMLGLYAVANDAAAQRQIEGIRSVKVSPAVRRLPGAGRITFGRTLVVEVEVDDLAFQGGSSFLLGRVLARFFARHASVNTAVETVLRSQSRGEVMRSGLSWGRGAVL
ncbi:type VI secretion system baseplate subunit TssF [soil metagenome]